MRPLRVPPIQLAPLVLLVLPACVPLYGNFTKVDFESAVQPAPASGEWKLAEIADAPSPQHVYAQTGKSSEEQFNVALFERVSVKDADVRVKLRAGAGELDQGGGLVWRAKDEHGYYLARWNPLESDVRAYQVVKGVRTQLASSQVKASPGWHTLRVWMRGKKIEVWFDGKSQFELESDTLAQSGMIGLWTKADAQTQFDDLEIQEL